MLDRYYILWYYPLYMKEITFEYDYRTLQTPETGDEEMPEGCDRIFYPGEIEQVRVETRGPRNFNAIDRGIRRR
jgi:hypothetical protein